MEGFQAGKQKEANNKAKQSLNTVLYLKDKPYFYLHKSLLT
jgi:hypothetical protein